MKYLKTYEALKKSYNEQDHHTLDDLNKDINNIILDIVDEYNLTNLTPEDEIIDFRFSNHGLDDTPNSYLIYNELRSTRHGQYGYVRIIINCESLYRESKGKSIDDPKNPLKELIARLDTIGHCDDITVMGGIEIRVIPRTGKTAFKSL